MLAKMRKKTTDTESEAPNLFRKDGARNLGFQQNQRTTNLAKLRKTKLLTQMRKLLTRYAKTGARNLGSQQIQHKTSLAKLRKTKLQT